MIDSVIEPLTINTEYDTDCDKCTQKDTEKLRSVENGVSGVLRISTTVSFSVYECSVSDCIR